MMRLLLLVDCYLPSTKSSAKLMHDLAHEFRALGCLVTVLTLDETMSQPFEVAAENGVRICRVRSGRLKGASKVRRAVNEIRLSAVIWNNAGRYLAGEPHDLIVYYSPSIFFGPLVGRLKTLWEAPAYLILRDIFPEWAVEAGVLRRGLIYRYFKMWERRSYRAADVIGVQSPYDIGYFHRHAWGGTFRLEVLRNWMGPLGCDLPTKDFRRQFGLENKIVFFYGGNIGVAQDMPNLLRLAEALKDDATIHFLFVGEGSEVGWFTNEIRRRRLHNITLHPAVDQTTYFAMLDCFDVGLISLDRRLKNNNIPGKLLGYLYFGKPTLASLNPGNELQKILEESGAGYATGNGDDTGLLRMAKALACDAGSRRRMGDNARRLLAEKFDARAIATQILAAMGPVPENPRRSTANSREPDTAPASPEF